MWLKVLGSGSNPAFRNLLVAVLQDWRKSMMTARMMAVGFLVAFGFAAACGMRTLMGGSR